MKYSLWDHNDTVTFTVGQDAPNKYYAFGQFKEGAYATNMIRGPIDRVLRAVSIEAKNRTYWGYVVYYVWESQP